MPELNKDDKRQKPEDPKKTEEKSEKDIVLEIKSDKFSLEERREILKIVSDDVEYGELIQADYVSQKELDLKHYHCVRPSELEGLQKEDWMSDRNLGLSRAIADMYQAVLFATCWNPDSINFVATRTFDIDNRNNQEKFAKWGMGKQEANASPEVDGFIHNRIIVGASFFKIYKKVWYEWVDRRIPVKNKEGKTYKWDIKTEKVRLEKGVIENIPDIDDILMPAYGQNLQELPFFIHRLHLDGEKVLDYLDRKVFIPSDVEKYKKKLYNHAYSQKKSKLGEEKLKQLGVSEETISDLDVRRLSITLYEWYGYYTKNDMHERYRFVVDLENDEFLSGKPVRKINRSGKLPFAGGSLEKEPGVLRGDSLMKIIAPPVNAFNNVYNQKQDFQYVENCPFGFHNPEEGYQEQSYKLKPGVSYPVAGEPARSVYFPNLQRSMAWAESDLRILFEILERLTGAATYFMTNQRGVSGTATRDVLIDKNSETKFGLWVKRILEDIQEAVGMWFELYQDYPPKNLAERILGEDGKQLFKNLAPDALRGDASVQMMPDIVAGSRAFKKQMQLQGFQLGQQMLWLNPQINPRGNWNFCADTLKEVLNLTDNEIKRYFPEQPKEQFSEAQLEAEWTRFKNGEEFDPPEGETAISLQHLIGHQKQRDEKIDELDEEYRPNFEAHLFKTYVNYMKFMRNMAQQMMADKLAGAMIMAGEAGRVSTPMPMTTPAPTPAPTTTPLTPEVTNA